MTWQLKPVTNPATNGEVRGDFRMMCDSAEDLLRATADFGGERIAQVRERMDQSLKTMKNKMSEAQGAVVDRARADARATDDYVRAHPWKSAGVAAGAGLLVGVLLSRR